MGAVCGDSTPTPATLNLGLDALERVRVMKEELAFVGKEVGIIQASLCLPFSHFVPISR